MKISIDISDDLLISAGKISGIKDESALIEMALQFFAAIETQKKLKNLYGKIELDDEAFK